MTEFKKLISILITVVMLVSASGCIGVNRTDPYDSVPESTAGQDVAPAPAADSVFSLNYNPKYSLNPMTATNHFNQLVCNLVYENMLEVDQNFQPISNIIKVDESFCDETGKTWTFKLNTDHVFHDGTPVTGKDLSYSLSYSIFSDRFTGRFASFKGSDFKDDTLYVYLGIGDTQFIKLLNIPVIKYGTFTTNREEHPVGSGPYDFSEDMTQLVAFEGHPYYDKLPVDTIYLQTFITAEETLDAYEDGTIDVAMNDPSSYSNLGYASTNEIHAFPTTNLHYVVINNESDVGRYATFRFAMNYAFDRANFENLLNGYAVGSSVPMYPTCSLYPTEFANSLSYNIDLVKTILENGGILDYDDDGRLELMQGGKSIEVTFLLCSDSSAKAGVVRKFVNDMDSIGIKVNVSSLTWDAYLEALANGEFDLYYGEMKLRADFDVTEFFDIRNKDNEDYNINFGRINDRNALDYINGYLSASENAQKDRYQEMCQYITDNGYLISIGFEKQQLITHRQIVRNVLPNIGNPLYNFENWQINIQ